MLVCILLEERTLVFLLARLRAVRCSRRVSHRPCERIDSTEMKTSRLALQDKISLSNNKLHIRPLPRSFPDGWQNGAKIWIAFWYEGFRPSPAAATYHQLPQITQLVYPVTFYNFQLNRTSRVNVNATPASLIRSIRYHGSILTNSHSTRCHFLAFSSTWYWNPIKLPSQISFINNISKQRTQATSQSHNPYQPHIIKMKFTSTVLALLSPGAASVFAAPTSASASTPAPTLTAAPYKTYVFLKDAP